MSSPRTLTAAVAAALALAAAIGATASSGNAVDAVPGIVDIFTNLAYQGEAAAGTGIVLTSSGEILTNNHVIRGATTVKVVDIDNGRSYKGKVLGYALSGDVAVVQLQNASGLQTAPIGHSSNLHVGAAVTAYGNAGGIGGTPSNAPGSIVGLGRSITARDDSGNSEKLTGLIETDAGLQPGDSGGPLVDASTQVIGMDTAAGSSFTYASSTTRGYAIPIGRATAIAAQIVAGRGSPTVHIGPTAFMGLNVSANDFYGGGSGLVVANVVPGSPMAKIGLVEGDVLVKFDGKAVNTPSTLTSLVVTKHPGDSVQIRWVDQVDAIHVATVKLAAGPPQ